MTTGRSTSERAKAGGAECVRLYRDDPSTFETNGLASFREVSVGRFQLRRLLVALPRLAALLADRGPGALRAAGEDACHWVGVRRTASRDEWRALTGSVAVLLYHGFDADGPGSRFVVPARRLATHLKLLGLLRRRVVPLDEYLDARRGHRLVDPRTVVLTIDDGYTDAFTVAGPLLERSEAPASLFVPTGRIGQVADWTDEPHLNGRPVAPRDLLVTRGALTIGAHSRSHASLPTLSPEELSAEVAGARDDLETVLGHRPRAFAYPYGDEDQRVRAQVLAAGYDAGLRIGGGRNLPAEPLDALRRIEIRGDDPWWRFVFAVLFGSPRPLSLFRNSFGA